MIVKGTGFRLRDDVSGDAEPEHDAGAADRVHRARHPAAHVDDRGRRRGRRSSAPPTTRCASGSTRSQLAARGVTAVGGARPRSTRRISCRRPARPRTSTSPTSITVQLDAADAGGVRRAAAAVRRRRQVVRLRDVAQRRAGRREHRHEIVTFNGQPGTFIGIFPTPAANPLDTADAVIAELPAIQATLPAGHDDRASSTIRPSTISASIEEVFKTIAEAVAIVVRRHPAVPRLVPLGADADRHHPAVADRRLLPAACAGLFDQPPVAARHGAGDRPRRRRRHRGGGEHPPPYRGGPHVADAGGLQRHARDLSARSSP